MLKKYVLDLEVKSVQQLNDRYVLLRLTDSRPLPEMLPGQFVELLIDHEPNTFLRRPISINFVDREANELWLLVACVGNGTRHLAQLHAGDSLNAVLPLGNGFSVPFMGPNGNADISSAVGVKNKADASVNAAGNDGSCSFVNGDSAVTDGSSTGKRYLLVGGGVGVAPLLYLGKVLCGSGIDVTFLLGARTRGDLLMSEKFAKYGRVLVTTEDGSMGEKGFVTNHSVLAQERFDMIQCCGPTPMMKAVARYASTEAIDCEVSLENLMACGLGACLCCVEKTVDGNLCVCKDGPVFNIKRLLWQI